MHEFLSQLSRLSSQRLDRLVGYRHVAPPQEHIVLRSECDGAPALSCPNDGGQVPPLRGRLSSLEGKGSGAKCRPQSRDQGIAVVNTRDASSSSDICITGKKGGTLQTRHADRAGGPCGASYCASTTLTPTGGPSQR